MKRKIYSFTEIQEIVKSQKKRKKKIVLCHGVFDLLHFGHIKHFEKSKTYGDILVVSVTSDKYINKGPNRPAFNEKIRSEALASLSVVDFVVISNSPTAVDIIKKLKPNFYSKGKDYKSIKNDITGKISDEIKQTKKGNGKIIFTDEITFSSSKILNSGSGIHSDEQSKTINRIKRKFKIQTINSLIDKLYKFKTLVFGEAILDQYVTCEALGRSGKDPLLMFSQIETNNYAGGSVAIARNVIDFYKDVELICSVGENKNFQNFFKKEIKKKIKTSFLNKKNSPTIIKRKYLDHITNNKLFGTYTINSDLISKKEELKILKILENNLIKKDIVILADYGHGLVTKKIANIFCKKSKFLIVNAQSNAGNIGLHSINKYYNYGAIIINEKELREEFRSKDDKIEILMKKVSKKYLIKNVVVTRGSEGSVLFNMKKSKFYYCAAFANNIIDKIGSGDVMMSIIAGLLKINCDPELALFVSSIAAGKSVESLANSNPVNKINLKKSLSHTIN